MYYITEQREWDHIKTNAGPKTFILHTVFCEQWDMWTNTWYIISLASLSEELKEIWHMMLSKEQGFFSFQGAFIWSVINSEAKTIGKLGKTHRAVCSAAGPAVVVLITFKCVPVPHYIHSPYQKIAPGLCVHLLKRIVPNCFNCCCALFSVY